MSLLCPAGPSFAVLSPGGSRHRQSSPCRLVAVNRALAKVLIVVSVGPFRIRVAQRLVSDFPNGILLYAARASVLQPGLVVSDEVAL